MSADAGEAVSSFRYAKVIVPDRKRAADFAETVRQYLPLGGNYRVAGIVLSDPAWLLIVGRDNAGWTLDEYVIPRMESGFIFPREITEAEATGVAGWAGWSADRQA